ncbi:MAG: PocR ligand-binding domain-containing protein [Deltaproteobacteria bacterium]|jgi:ligand-binding sensor protein|nr:PocR ligand-binding domain-containing protein [Deltaproteobacteria bacterium]
MRIYDFEDAIRDVGLPLRPSLGEVPGFERLKKILDDFSKFAAISCEALDDKAQPLTKRFGTNSLCARLSNSQDSADICARAHRIAFDESVAIRDPFTYVCPFGLIETAIPMFSKDLCIGAILAGQARIENVPLGMLDMGKSALVSFPEKSSDRDEGISKFEPIFQSINQSINQSTKESMSQSMIHSMFQSIPTMDYRNYESLISIINEVAQSFVENLQDINVAYENANSPNGKAAKHKLPTQRNKVGTNLFFLLNAVNTLANLSVLHGSEKINYLSILVARHIKAIINNSSREFYHLEDEKNNLIRYFNIQKLRFENILSFNVSLPLNIKDYLVPVDVILAFVERILLMNISTKADKFNISVFFKKERNNILVEISDNVSLPPSNVIESLKTPYKSDSEIKVVENRIIASTERLLSIFGNLASISIKAKENGGSKYLIRFPAIISELNDT